MNEIFKQFSWNVAGILLVILLLVIIPWGLASAFSFVSRKLLKASASTKTKYVLWVALSFCLAYIIFNFDAYNLPIWRRLIWPLVWAAIMVCTIVLYNKFGKKTTK